MSLRGEQKQKLDNKKDQKRCRKLNLNAEKFRRSELLEKYIAKILFGQNDRKFENKYLKKLERSWQRWKLVSPEKKP